MGNKVRWGILGAGRIAHTFAKDIQHCQSAKLVAVGSRSRERSEAFAAEYDLSVALDNYEALYQSEDIDAIYIASPHSCHLEQGIAALKAGKHLLVEKPITLNPAECKQLIDTARTSNGFLMEAMWTHFLPAIKTAKAWLDKGKIGRLIHIKADFGYPLLPYRPDLREYDAKLGGGCLLEMGVYPVAIDGYFGGYQTPKRYQVSARYAPNGVEDDLSIVIDHETYTATLGTSFRCKLQNWCYLIGDKGYIAIPDFWRADKCFRYELDTLVEEFHDDRKDSGFSFEIDAASSDILDGNTENKTFSWAISQEIQDRMDSILST